MNEKSANLNQQAPGNESECGNFFCAMRKTGLNRHELSATTAVAGSISAPANGASACRLIETEVASCESYGFTRLALPAFTSW